MRKEYLCLQTVVAAPYEDKYADGYVVQCLACERSSDVLSSKSAAITVYDRVRDGMGGSCNFAIFPVVGENPPYVVQHNDAVVVWRADMPGLEPRKIALTNADFRKCYGKAE